jgi:predicted GIY-YIG superfamily endonuclease
MNARLDHILTRARVRYQCKSVRPDEAWAISPRTRAGRRAHLIREAAVAWPRGKETYFAAYICDGGGDRGVQLVTDVPDDIEPCDDCLIGGEYDKPTVYRLYDTTDELAYVGFSEDFLNRMKQHSQTKEWWPQIKRCEFDLYETREEGMAAELELIQLHQPRFNKMHTAHYRAILPHPPRRREPVAA